MENKRSKLYVWTINLSFLEQSYQIDIFSIIIFLGVVQGLFLGIQFFTGSRRQVPGNIFLGAFILGITLVIWEIFLCYSAYIVQLIHFYDFAEPTNFLLAPLVYLYIYTSIHQKPPKAYQWHFLPFVFYFLYAILFFIQSPEFKYNAFLDAYHPKIIPKPTAEFLQVDPLNIKKYINPISVFYTFVYTFLSFLHLNQYFGSSLKDWVKIKDQQQIWLRNFFILFAINLGHWFYRTFFVIRDLGDYLSAVFNALIIYYVSFIIMRNSAFFSPPKPDNKKYEKSTLDKMQKERIAFRVKKIMSEEKLFMENSFSLTDLADSIGSPPHHISQVLNEHFQQNFFHFVAQYRVEEAKNLLTDPTKTHFTIEAIAEMVGYHSKSAFNRAFKRITGVTPSVYRKTGYNP